jgi:hypothetical protein
MLTHPLLTREQEDHIVASLAAARLLSENDIADAKRHAELNEGTLFDLAIERTALSPAEATQLIAREFGWRVIDLARWKPTAGVHTKIPLEVAKMQRMLPFAEEDDHLDLALEDPRSLVAAHPSAVRPGLEWFLPSDSLEDLERRRTTPGRPRKTPDDGTARVRPKRAFKPKVKAEPVPTCWACGLPLPCECL